MTNNAIAVAQHPEKRLAFFERYLTLWVVLCMAAGLAFGKLLPSAVQSLRGLEFGQGSRINVPIAILIWLMIPVVPFLGFSVGKIAGITTVLIIAGEITFYLSIFLIGKEFLVKIKNKFRRKKDVPPEIDPVD